MTTVRRVAVVTGAAQGIGRRVAEVFAAQGYRLVLVDLREPAETLAALGARSGGVPGGWDAVGSDAVGAGGVGPAAAGPARDPAQ